MVITTIEVKPENMDEFARIWREGSIDVKSFRGFKEGYLVTNRELGKAVIVGLWETEADGQLLVTAASFRP